MGDPITYMVVTAAISYLAARLLAPKPPKTPLDDSKTEPSHRGTLLGLMAGHYRIGPVIGFVGGRFTGSTSTNTAYYERGWHILNCGEIRSLRRIFEGGKAIWQGNMTPATHPSGSAVHIEGDNLGYFYIYWGEDDQPVNASLASYIGVDSAWPNIAYIWWDVKQLGPSPVWPQLEYEITVEPKSTVVSGDAFFDFGSVGTYTNVVFQTNTYRVSVGVPLTANKYEYTFRMATETAVPYLAEGMDVNLTKAGVVVIRAQVVSISRTGGYTYVEMNVPIPRDALSLTLGWSNSTYRFNSDAFSDMGASPAFTLAQFLFQPRPFGAGLDRSKFDNSLQDLQTLMVSEGMPCTSLLRSGRSWKDGIASIMQDMGILLVFDPSTGLYGFKPLREGETVTEIPLTAFDGDSLEETFAYSVLASDARIFSYKDSARNFTESTIPATDDAQAQYGADPNVKTINLETITSYLPASKAASRRDAELNIDASSALEVSYLYSPVVGDLVKLEDSGKLYRVAEVTSNPDEASRKIQLVKDAYSIAADYTIKYPQGLNPANRTKPAPDTITGLLEVSRFEAKDTHGYKVVRIRPNVVPSSALVMSGQDGVSFTMEGEQVESTGGLLTEEFDSSSANLVESGPVVSLLGDDIDLILDLSSREADWRAGMQMCLINNELFYLRNISIESTDPITFRLEGLIRARMGTAKGDHAIDDVVLIYQPSNLETFAPSWLLPGQDLHVKTLPYTEANTVSIENALPSVLDPYQGGGYRPLPCENLTTDNDVDAWVAGTDVDLIWDYKVATGAGMLLSDQASSLVLPEGTFKLEFLTTGDVLKRTVAGLASASYTYANATLASDFGSEPASFKVRVYNELNSLTSETTETTLTRV